MTETSPPPRPARRRGAGIDVGSNSVHLLVADVTDGGLRTVLDESVLLGLGEIVDREKSLPPDAIAATVDALRGYVRRASGLGARHVTLVGTEPLRRASNRSVLQADVLRSVGLPLHVLSHEAEACLTLLGVTAGQPAGEALLVLDVGGGSTELILAMPDRDPVIGALPTGSARLTATLVEHDPPSWFEISALRAEARRLVAGLPDGLPSRGILVGGSSTNLVRVVPDGPASRRLDAAALDGVFSTLASRQASDLVASGAVNVRRATQLAAGAALVEAVLERYGLAQLEVADTSLRDGAILAAEAAGDTWPDRLWQLVATSR